MASQIASWYEQGMEPLAPELRRPLRIAPAVLILAVGFAPLVRAPWIGWVAGAAFAACLVGLHRTGRAGPARSALRPSSSADGGAPR